MKIVQAVNAMIFNREKITDVQEGRMSGEYFFVYDQKYKWSIQLSRVSAKEDYRLYFYPGPQALGDLSSWDENDWQEFSQMVSYSSDDIGTKEARSTFAELYQVVKERELGIDTVLDDIIGDMGI